MKSSRRFVSSSSATCHGTMIHLCWELCNFDSRLIRPSVLFKLWPLPLIEHCTNIFRELLSTSAKPLFVYLRGSKAVASFTLSPITFFLFSIFLRIHDTIPKPEACLRCQELIQQRLEQRKGHYFKASKI